jgi:O-antigen ligase
MSYDTKIPYESHKSNMVLVLIYLLLFAYWLDRCAGFQLEKLFGLASGLSLQNLSMYLLLIVWALTLKTRGTFFQQNNVNKYLVILMIIMAVSIFPNVYGYGVQKTSLKKEIVAFKNFINPWIFFFLITTLVNDKRTCKRVITGLILFLLVTVFTVLIQNFMGIKLGTHLSGKSYVGRSAGFAEANQYAAFLVLFLPLFLSPIFLKDKQLERIKGFFLFFIGLIGLLFTVSKGGIIAFFVSMGCFFFYAYRKRLITKMRIFLYLYLLLAMGATSFLLLPSQTREIAAKRFTLEKVGPYNPWAVREFSFLHKLTSGRTQVWMYSLGLIARRPILGYGSSADKNQLDLSTHSDLLRWLVNHGIIGFLLFSMIYIKIFRHVKYHLKTSTNLKSRILYLGYMFGFIGYVTAMCGVNIYDPRIIFWMYTAIIYKYAHLDTIEKTESALPMKC